MKTFKINIKGLSLLELLEKHGKGLYGFMTDTWRDKPFASEKPEPGEYEFEFKYGTVGKDYEKQLSIFVRRFFAYASGTFGGSLILIFSRYQDETIS